LDRNFLTQMVSLAAGALRRHFFDVAVLETLITVDVVVVFLRWRDGLGLFLRELLRWILLGFGNNLDLERGSLHVDLLHRHSNLSQL